MTDRKFTKPTKFPAEYVNRNGDKAVILGRGPNKQFPFIGYDADGDAVTWTERGEYYSCEQSGGDLHDIPKRITTWQNVYATHMALPCDTRDVADHSAGMYRVCVYRIERDADGGNFEIFKEEV